MDLIKELDDQFLRINTILIYDDENIENINRNNSKLMKRINNIYDLLEEKCKNGLNERRDEMLKQLIIKRDQDLHQVNIFIHKKHNLVRLDILLLKFVNESIKPRQASFIKGLSSVYEFLLLISDHSYPFKFYKLANLYLLNRKKKTTTNKNNK